MNDNERVFISSERNKIFNSFCAMMKPSDYELDRIFDIGLELIKKTKTRHLTKDYKKATEYSYDPLDFVTRCMYLDNIGKVYGVDYELVGKKFQKYNDELGECHIYYMVIKQKRVQVSPKKVRSQEQKKTKLNDKMLVLAKRIIENNKSE